MPTEGSGYRPAQAVRACGGYPDEVIAHLLEDELFFESTGTYRS
jgi:hypothetical protein